MSKTVLFSRVSTLGQDLIQQQQALYGAAKCSREDIIEISDKESGIQLAFEEREGITELMQVIETEQVERIIIFEISRLARRPDVFYKVRDVLVSKHIQLQCLTPAFELLNDDGSINENSNLLIGIFLSMAESEMRIKKARFKRGKQRAKEDGRNFGFRHKLGYTTDKNHKCIVDTQSATIIKRIFNEYINGKSSYAIAAELMEAGYLPHYKHRLYGGMRVCQILRDKHYLGDNYYQRIIDDGTFYKVQDKLDSQPHKTVTRKNTDFWCKGIMKYEDTGETFVVKAQNGCYQTAHTYKSISKRRIHKIVTDVMNEYYKMTALTEDDVMRDKTRAVQMLYRKLATAAKEQKQIMDRKDKLWERNIEGKISDEKAEKMSKNYDISLNTLHQKCLQWQKEIDDIQKQEVNISLTDFNSFTDTNKFEELNKAVDVIKIKCPSPRQKIFTFCFKDGTVITRNVI